MQSPQHIGSDGEERGSPIEAVRLRKNEPRASNKEAKRASIGGRAYQRNRANLNRFNADDVFGIHRSDKSGIKQLGLENRRRKHGCLIPLSPRHPGEERGGSRTGPRIEADGDVKKPALLNSFFLLLVTPCPWSWLPIFRATHQESSSSLLPSSLQNSPLVPSRPGTVHRGRHRSSQLL